MSDYSAVADADVADAFAIVIDDSGACNEEVEGCGHRKFRPNKGGAGSSLPWRALAP